MSTFKKPALVLIISCLLFAGMKYLLDFEPLDFIRTRFYNPSLVNSIVRENEKAAEIVQNHILTLQNRFSAALNEPAVKSSFLYNQTAADIYERSRVFGILVESVSGLQSVQLVDANGVRIHYSTSSRDLIDQNGNSASYRNYTDDSRALPYDDISAGADESPKYTMDDSHDRIIFSFPFYDSMDVYRGTALFTLSVRALAESLITGGSLKPTDDISVIRLPRGIVFGSPNTSKNVILGKIASVWNDGFREYVTIDAEDAGVKYALISTKTGDDLFFGRIINDSFFSIPESKKLIFQLSMFLTLFLTLYFIINFKPHPVTLVQNRIKTLRTNLFEQLYIKKTWRDRAKWIMELEQRRDEVSFEIKSRLKIKRGFEKKIDDIIDKAWDELLAVMKSGHDAASLEEIVKTRAVNIEKSKTEDAEDLEEIDEAEALDEAEAVEEIEDAEEIEEVGEIEEIEELEDSDEVETEGIKSYTKIHLSKGLLKTASEILAKIKNEESKPLAPALAGKGLLKRAIELQNSTGGKPEEPPGKGLLTLASAYKRKTPETAVLSTENLSVREIESDNNFEVDEAGQGMLFDMEVVSPFPSMFSSLENVTSSTRAD